MHGAQGRSGRSLDAFEAVRRVMVSSVLDPTTTRSASRQLRGAYILDAAVTEQKKLAPTVFLLSFLLNHASPGLGTLGFISCSVKSCWVAKPLLNKGPHNVSGPSLDTMDTNLTSR